MNKIKTLLSVAAIGLAVATPTLADDGGETGNDAGTAGACDVWVNGVDACTKALGFDARDLTNNPPQPDVVDSGLTDG